MLGTPRQLRLLFLVPDLFNFFALVWRDNFPYSAAPKVNAHGVYKIVRDNLKTLAAQACPSHVILNGMACHFAAPCVSECAGLGPRLRLNTGHV